MNKKKIFILSANPVKDSTSNILAKKYEEASKSVGHEVRMVNILDMDFDPVLHKGYTVIQDLEPDLVKFQENIKWADHLVFVYPNWWSTMPAKMKGLFDRAFLPGFAFNMKKDGGRGMHKLLKNKSARIINVSGSIGYIAQRILIGDCLNELKNGILKSCGVSPVKVTFVGPTKGVTQSKKDKWFQKIEKLGKKGI